MYAAMTKDEGNAADGRFSAALEMSTHDKRGLLETKTETGMNKLPSVLDEWDIDQERLPEIDLRLNQLR